MSRDGRCAAPVLVQTADGNTARLCTDPTHKAGTDHHTRYRGTVIAWPHGTNRVQVADTGQPTLV